MGPGWAGGREESVPGNAGGRTTCSVITMGPRSLWRTWLKIQSLFRCPQRMVHPPPTGHLRARLKNGTWTGPNGFPSSLRALSALWFFIDPFFVYNFILNTFKEITVKPEPKLCKALSSAEIIVELRFQSSRAIISIKQTNKQKELLFLFSKSLKGIPRSVCITYSYVFAQGLIVLVKKCSCQKGEGTRKTAPHQ